ncbi:hypothetical protein FS795_22255 [Agrobacterium vitis]|nr:hypothetical protein [Allorhizobium ampelinum]
MINWVKSGLYRTIEGFRHFHEWHVVLDDVVDRQSLTTSSSPILPLHLRPALLAGIAIVERSGPEMLQMLHSQMMGENKARFSSAIISSIGGELVDLIFDLIQ